MPAYALFSCNSFSYLLFLRLPSVSLPYFLHVTLPYVRPLSPYFSVFLVWDFSFFYNLIPLSLLSISFWHHVMLLILKEDNTNGSFYLCHLLHYIVWLLNLVWYVQVCVYVQLIYVHLVQLCIYIYACFSSLYAQYTDGNLCVNCGMYIYVDIAKLWKTSIYYSCLIILSQSALLCFGQSFTSGSHWVECFQPSMVFG